MLKYSVIFFFILSILIVFSNGLSVSFSKDVMRCIYDTFYQNTVIIYNYEFDEDTMNIEALVDSKTDLFTLMISEEAGTEDPKNPTQPKIFKTSKTKGKFAYTIEKTHAYQVCMIINNSKVINRKLGTKMRLNMETSFDDYEEDPNAVKMKDFSQVDQKIKHLMKKVEMVHSIQKHQTNLEQEFSVSQIQSNRLISIFAICQILIICFIGMLHMFSLRKILKNKV